MVKKQSICDSVHWSVDLMNWKNQTHRIPGAIDRADRSDRDIHIYDELTKAGLIFIRMLKGGL